MKKDVKIGEKLIPMSANAFTPFLFKDEFGGDIVTGMGKVADGEGNIDTIFLSKAAYIMAKSAADGDEFPTLREWLEDFEILDIASAAADIINVWAINNETSSKPRKK